MNIFSKRKAKTEKHKYRKVVVHENETSFDGFFHQFGTKDDKTLAIIEVLETGEIKMVDPTAVKFLETSKHVNSDMIGAKKLGRTIMNLFKLKKTK